MPLISRAHAGVAAPQDRSRRNSTTLVSQSPTGSGPYLVADVKPGERIVLAPRSGLLGPRTCRSAAAYTISMRSTSNIFATPTAYSKLSRPGFSIFAMRPIRRAGRMLTISPPSAIAGSSGRPCRPEGPRGWRASSSICAGHSLSDSGFARRSDLIFDFEWINANLFDGLYKRTKSFFDDSELASTGRAASAAERALLAPFPGAVRDDIMEGRWRPAATDGSGRDRTSRKRALALLNEAG